MILRTLLCPVRLPVGTYMKGGCFKHASKTFRRVIFILNKVEESTTSLVKVLQLS